MNNEIISAVDELELVGYGSRFPLPRLLSQADYIKELLERVGEAVTRIVGQGLVERMLAVMSELHEVSGDWTVARDESRVKTIEQGHALSEATLWMRQARTVGEMLRRRGVDGGADLARIVTRSRSLPAVAKEVEDKVELVEKYSDQTPNPEWTGEFIGSGKAIAVALREASATQDVELAQLPAKTRHVYELKGLLYLAMKQVNDAGKILYARNRKRAREFNMNILNRKGARRKEAGEEGKEEAGSEAVV